MNPWNIKRGAVFKSFELKSLFRFVMVKYNGKILKFIKVGSLFRFRFWKKVGKNRKKCLRGDDLKY